MDLNSKFDFNNAKEIIDEDIFLEQRQISKDSFFKMKDDESTHRKIFTKSSLQLNKTSGMPTCSVKFGETIIPILYKCTGVKLEYSPQFDNYWKYVDDEKIKRIQKWESEQGCRVFLRDMLFSSIALNMLFDENKIKTKHGEVFTTLKYHQTDKRCFEFFPWVINEFCIAIQGLPYYNKCKYICAVPPRPGKGFDLPSAFAQHIASSLSLIDITSKFSYKGTREQVKICQRDVKWEAWEKANIDININNIHSEDVILIDDLYQSGVSVNYVAMKLQQAGFRKVCGLYLVKSRRDTDNTQE